MRNEVIEADGIGDAAQQILDQLKADTSTDGRSKGNVTYFDGWEGLGASAVLRAIAQRLTVASSGGPQFEKIIHIDCSKWESRRALQRAIAKQLELPSEVMEMFDRQDEEDDYNGLDQGSRVGIPKVQREMHRRIQDLNCRFLVIFHNGSNEEIDLASFGFPLSEYLDNKVLWTFQGRFRLYPKIKIHEALRKSSAINKTDVFLSVSKPVDGDPLELWPILVRQESAEVVQHSLMASTDQLAESFILHTLKLCCIGHHFMMDYDLATHAGNYWILQRGEDDEGDELWHAADAFKREMLLDVDYYKYNHQYFPSHLIRYGNSSKPPHEWTWLPLEFLPLPIGAIPNADLFQDFDKLSVLKLSRRTYDFSSPPYAHCRNLKFLWLDNCHDEQEKIVGSREEVETNKAVVTGAAGIGRLLVLHVLNTRCDQILSGQMMDHMIQLRELNVTGAEGWDMGQLQGSRLPNIHKLRVTKSTISCNSEMFPATMMKKIELLEFSGNHIVGSSGLPTTITANNSLLLETVIIDEGCLGVEQISFRCCANLKNVLLRGLFKGLKSIDISGTSVKTLDLSEVEAKELDESVALGCGKLCAILWPPKEKMNNYLMKLRIGTIIEDSSNATSSLTVQYGSRAPTEYAWYVSISDARLLRSLVVVKELGSLVGVHMEISTPGVADTGGSKEERSIFDCGPVNQQKRQEQPEPEISSGGESVVYADVSAATQNTDQAITHKWPEPRAPFMNANDCYMYIQDDQQDAISSWSITVPNVICDATHILHVHDSKSITRVESGPLEGSSWSRLWWCRVERCPSLDCVFFVCPQAITRGVFFWLLNTLWCSQLPKVRCIWDFSGLVSSKQPRIDEESFLCMTFMHVDMCPRLTHVLPLSAAIINSMFRYRLETLEIVWCGDTRALFPLEEEVTTTTIEFKWLKRIHLRELPQLQGICGRRRRIYTPNLESIQIRGCWSLTRLPAVGGGKYKYKVECDCEKEWWDKLKWDGMRVNHHPSLYKPTHPQHYKKTLLRRTVLQ